jgi:hypothetical protein
MIRPVHIPLAAAYCNAATASGGASTITLTKRAGYTWVLGSIHWNYRTDPTSGSITVASGGTTFFTQFITSKGPGFTNWACPRTLPSITDGQTYTITLADGTAIKDLNVEAWEIPTDQT